MKKGKDTNKFIERKPFRNTIEIILIYIVIGILWIYFSDLVLGIFVQDSEVTETIQTYKGIFYVLFTGVLFYLIIKRRMDLYDYSIIELKSTVDKLGETNKTLTTLEEKLYTMAYYDDLTGLFSKNMIIESFQEHMHFNENEILGVMYLDIDNFKDINETRGHDAGDELIQMVAEELKTVFGEPNKIGRISGDEFIIYIKEQKDKAALENYVAERFSLIKHTYKIRRDHHYVTFSAGVTVYPSDDHTFTGLLKWSDLALNIAKEKGKNQVAYYSKDLAETVFYQSDIANQLYYGNKNKEFKLHYQPIVSSIDLKVRMVEVLVRWENPFKGFIYPEDFIEIAEKTGHIIEMTYFVIGESLKQQKKWRDEGYDITVSINISSKVLNEKGFITKLKKMMSHYDADPSKCILEVTESMVVQDLDHAIDLLNELRKFGFKIALDDFGTGYSSMTYLQKLPIDILKIDRSFIRELSKSDHSVQMLEFMINLAHLLELKVITEGVEEEAQLELLQKLKSDYQQGYFFAKPTDSRSIDKSIFLKSDKNIMH